MTKGPKSKAIQDRLFEHSMPEPNSGCWLWTGSIMKSGYGQIGVGSMLNGTRTMVGAHRVSYEVFKEKILEDLFVLHKCDVKTCINPDHLFLGTQADNNADKLAKGHHHYARRTHCKKGHPYFGDNLLLRSDGGRRCRACERNRSRLRA